MCDWLPKHSVCLALEHNEHKSFYLKIEEYYDPDDFISEEEWKKCVEEDEVWVLRWYPDTPVGGYVISASSLQAIQKQLKEANYG